MKSNCKTLLRVFLGLIGIGLIPLLIHLHDVGAQYGVVDYFTFSVLGAVERRPHRPKGVDKVGDKIIVMAKLEEEDTSWVVEELPDWQRAIYTVNPSVDSTDVLTTSINKGHESMAYLTYVIDHYNSSLPSIIAFLHSHRDGFLRAWHTDSPLHDNVAAMRALQIPFVARNGYVNLRCNWNPGCGTNVYGHVTPTIWEEVFNDTSTPPSHGSVSRRISSSDPTSSKEDRHRAIYFGGQTSAACCAQFAVTREQVLKRPVEDYIRFRDWLIQTEKNDAQSGRVMEYLWHVIFGMESVYCPDEDFCYCSVYGRC